MKRSRRNRGNRGRKRRRMTTVQYVMWVREGRIGATWKSPKMEVWSRKNQKEHKKERMRERVHLNKEREGWKGRGEMRKNRPWKEVKDEDRQMVSWGNTRESAQYWQQPSSKHLYALCILDSSYLCYRPMKDKLVYGLLWIKITLPKEPTSWTSGKQMCTSLNWRKADTLTGPTVLIKQPLNTALWKLLHWTFEFYNRGK